MSPKLKIHVKATLWIGQMTSCMLSSNWWWMMFESITSPYCVMWVSHDCHMTCSLQLFIQDNQGGEETTVINHIGLFGTPLDSTNMKEFKRVSTIPTVPNFLQNQTNGEGLGTFIMWMTLGGHKLAFCCLQNGKQEIAWYISHVSGIRKDSLIV